MILIMTNKKRFFIIFAAVLLLLAFAVLASLCLGSISLSPYQLLSGLLLEEKGANESFIIYKLRLPRALAAIIAGAGLSLAGVLLQGIMGNELASPGTVGISSGAGLAVVITLSLFPGLSHLLPITSFVGAVAASVAVIAVGRMSGGGKSGIILAGIGISSVCSAAVSFISSVDTDVLAQYSAFSVGGFSGVRASSLIVPAIIVSLCFLLSLTLSGRIAVLSLGDRMAASLGIEANAMRTLCLVICAFASSAVVSFAGLLGFVGLVVPNLTRRMVGAEMKKQLLLAPLMGALLLVAADSLGRVLFVPSEISVGIITAFVGAPCFFFLILKSGRGGNRHGR